MSQSTQGLLLLCGCCNLPFWIGFFIAWKLRPRVQRLGWRGAFIPKFIRDRWERE